MSDEPKSEQEPKLVVDTDWKEQVAKEKAEATAGPEPEAEDLDRGPDSTVAESNPENSDAENSDAENNDAELPPPPPASFEVLISLLFTQAMGTLGHMPHPATGKVEVNKPYAKHYIDTLEMLGEKTKGNLSDDESKMLSEALHALRMAYVGANNA